MLLNGSTRVGDGELESAMKFQLLVYGVCCVTRRTLHACIAFRMQIAVCSVALAGHIILRGRRTTRTSNGFDTTPTSHTRSTSIKTSWIPSAELSKMCALTFVVSKLPCRAGEFVAHLFHGCEYFYFVSTTLTYFYHPFRSMYCRIHFFFDTANSPQSNT